MTEKQNKPISTVSPERVKDFIETLDKLAYEKPAGFAAYMATCMSSMKMADFTERQTSVKKSNK
jgi:hypothetical protein